LRILTSLGDRRNACSENGGGRSPIRGMGKTGRKQTKGEDSTDGEPSEPSVKPQGDRTFLGNWARERREMEDEVPGILEETYGGKG